jgi:hypothetical protein
VPVYFFAEAFPSSTPRKLNELNHLMLYRSAHGPDAARADVRRKYACRQSAPRTGANPFIRGVMRLGVDDSGAED